MFTSVILAAGMGTRMKSKMPKVLHKVCGKPLSKWVIDASKAAGADKVCAVVGHKAEMCIRDSVKHFKFIKFIKFIKLKKQKFKFIIQFIGNFGFIKLKYFKQFIKLIIRFIKLIIRFVIKL